LEGFVTDHDENSLS